MTRRILRISEQRHRPKEYVFPMMQPDSITITIPALAPGLHGGNGLMRMHFRKYKRLRDTWTLLVRSEARGARFDKCAIRITRYNTGYGMDPDNLVSTAKVPLDALRHAGVIRDDDPLSVVSLEVRQEQVRRVADRRTVIEIREAV
mgnify:CR=1 FL=1